MTQIYSTAIDNLLLSHWKAELLDTSNAFYNENKHLSLRLQRPENNNNNNNNNNKLQLGCHPMAVVILHVNKT